MLILIIRITITPIVIYNENITSNSNNDNNGVIDVNSDGLMDVMCDNAVQHHRMVNHFLINKGNMQFDFVSQKEVTKWVHWMK